MNLFKNPFKTRTMSTTKTLQLDEATALRLYGTAAPEFKAMLEHNFGKAFFNQKISDVVKGYDDVCRLLSVCNDDSDMQVSIDGFDAKEHEILKYCAKMMRIAKVYNQGWLPKRGERRYYAWANLSGSGFVFLNADYVDACAYSASAAHLCFKTAEDAKDAFNKHIDIYRGFIGLG